MKAEENKIKKLSARKRIRAAERIILSIFNLSLDEKENNMVLNNATDAMYEYKKLVQSEIEKM